MSNTVTLHRIFKCPPLKLYRAFLDPRALVKWMAPHGFVAEVHEMNPQVGGGYSMSFINFGTGAAHRFGGRYIEMIEGEKLRYSDSFDDPNLPGQMNVTITFRQVLCGTELHIVQEGLPEQVPVEFCFVGWQESLSMLAGIVEPEIP